MKKLLFSLLGLLLCVATVTAQRTVTGTVKDDKGEALIGATVLVKGTTIGTVTDVEGAYSVNVPTDGNILIFSYTGYETQEITLGASNVVDVVLATSAVGLDEVIVVGYGAQAKRDVTGSISKVKGESIANLATPSFESQLAGRAAGVQITPPSGILGAPPQIRIRGVNSITSGTGPLIVVDGVPIISGDVSGFTQTNSLADINPTDIESFEILKDGAATAIYGSRASNGVLLITTKKGKEGKAQFNYDSYFGFAQATNLFDILNAEQFVEIQNEKNRNAGGTSNVAALQTNTDGSFVETNWLDELFQTGFQQSHAFSVTGGTNTTNYYFSAGYTDQEGVAVANSLTRYSFRGNLEQTVNSWLKIGFNSGVSRQEVFGLNTGGNALSGNTFGAIRMLPNVAVFDPTDPTGYNIDDTDRRALGRGANTLVIANGIPNTRFVVDNNTRAVRTWRLLGNAYADFNLNFIKGLTFRTQLGLDGSYVDEKQFDDPRHGDGQGANGRIFQNFIPTTRWNWQNILNYNNSFSGKHNVGITLVQEYQKQRESFFQAGATNISDRFFNENIISGTASNQTVDGDLEENGIASYLARFNYNFANRYYISGSIRRDALSSLPEANRVGYFPGASFAWRISEEGFWNGLRDVVSDFRLRGSFAEVGNTDIGNYPYIGSYGSAQYGNQNGIGYNNFGNDQLKWESQLKFDAGFDLGLLNNRINLSFAYWLQDNADIILQVPTAPSLGVPNTAGPNRINRNVGQIRNQGIELTIDADVIRTGRFGWNTSFNFTTQQNEVLELVNDQDIILSNNYNIAREGESLYAIYGFDYWGVNPANGNPVFRKADGILVQNDLGDGAFYIFNPNDAGTRGERSTLSQQTDRRILGSAIPKWFGGWDNNISMGDFDLNVFFRFSGGNVIMNNTREDLLDMGFNNNGTEILGRWQSPENPGDGRTPKIVLDRSNLVNFAGSASTRWVEKGDFIRLGNVTLGYSLPKNLTQKLKIQRLRIFAQAQNAFTITDYTGLDPETNTNGFGVDDSGNPQQRVFTFGVNLGF